MIEIRKAQPEDAPVIAACLLLAMEEIVYGFIGSANRQQALAFMAHFTAGTHNQYAYGNCMVAAINGTVVGAVNIYDGAQLELLRAPVIDYIHRYYNPHFTPEAETAAGEYYLDTFGVLPACQGKGVGALLLRTAIDTYVHHQGKVLGLLVTADNPEAKRLYIRLGFRTVGSRILFGKEMEHLQIGSL